MELRPIQIQIDYEKEEDRLKNILERCNKRIKFLSAVATRLNFSRCLDKNPRYVHFCGHGASSDLGDSLIFEDDCGASDQVNC